MRIVGSLTTIPTRIFKIKKVLDSILAQSYPLDKLYINIPWYTTKNIIYKIPFFLTSMENKICTINRCTDYGPITKLLPTLDKENEKDTYIITFDDDRVVHRDVVKIIQRKILQYPNSVLSFSGWNSGLFPFYLDYQGENSLDIDVDWVQGCHSITYPRSTLDRNRLMVAFTEYPNRPEFLGKHDDHKISAYLEVNGIRKISIGIRGKNADSYFQPTVCCKINAISGGDLIMGKISYFSQVLHIVNFFRKLGIYHRPYFYFYNTTTFKIMLGICIVFICIFLYKKIS